MADAEQSEASGLIKPPVIMKIDGPAEDSSKEENEDNERNESNEKEFKMCSPINTFKSTLNSNPFTTTNKFAKGILKPAQLSVNISTSSSNKPFVLKPSTLNPFTGKPACANNSSDNSDKKQINGETHKFVPLLKNETESVPKVTHPQQPTNSTGESSETPSNSSFVFGQNLHDRVMAGENANEEPKPSTSLSSNGTTDMLFTSAIKNEVKSDGALKESKTLSESAREYEELRANKRKYEEVEVRTGEEEETNVLSISCKLFSFHKITSSWQERGRGTLRLNDFEIDKNHTGSRLVFRTSGSFRVILNTKIWAEMTVEQASKKSIRLTALDSNGEVKVFLIMSNMEDTTALYTHLQGRLEKEISEQKRKKIADSGGK